MSRPSQPHEPRIVPHRGGHFAGGAYLRNMTSPALAQTACPDCPATRLSVFETLVFDGTCRFRCLAVPARQPLPGGWMGAYRAGLVRRGVLVRQRVDRQGRVTSVDAVGPAGLFLLPEPSALTPGSIVTGYAATDLRICLLPSETLSRTVSSPEVSGDLIKMQEMALDRVERLADARGRPTAEARVAAVLCTLADTLSPPRRRDRIPADFQQRDLANLAGIRHETVCRVLGDLEAREVVQRDTDGLRIVNRETLEVL